jgi:hypothetical protein
VFRCATWSVRTSERLEALTPAPPHSRTSASTAWRLSKQRCPHASVRSSAISG